MKKLLFIISFLALAGAATAQHMAMETEKGNTIVALADLKEVTFNGTTVNIEQTDGTKFSASMGEISRIYFGDLSSIAEIESQDYLITYLSPDEIAIHSASGSVATIYNLTGAQMLSKRINTEGEVMSIANLPQGIYIVKANEKTTKIIKR